MTEIPDSNQKSQFIHRHAFAPWINDVRNRPIISNWPDVSIDSQLLEDYRSLFDLLKEAGFDSITIFGLLTNHNWPPELETVFSKKRKNEANNLIGIAHNKGLKVNYGMGIYSWGFDEIIKYDPKVRGTSRSAMCGSKHESRQWQEKVIEMVVSNLDIDGFHLEASDQGRCSCEKCIKENNVEYYSRLNKEAAIFIKERWPDKYLLVNDCAYLAWGNFIDKKDFKYIYDLGNHIDSFNDNGNHGLFIREEDRKEFIEGLSCSFASSGGFWVYPPQRWDRLSWFLPYVKKTGNFLKSLYVDGGRACEYYMGPTINPGTEVNIYAGGMVLSDTERNLDKILQDVLDKLYRPKNSSYLEELIQIYNDAEDAFFGNWQPSTKPFELPEEFAADVETLSMWSKDTPERTIPGELFLETLVGNEPGDPLYLTDNMDKKGLVGYMDEMEKILARTQKIKDGFNDDGRISRIIICIGNIIEDINKLLK